MTNYLRAFSRSDYRQYGFYNQFQTTGTEQSWLQFKDFSGGYNVTGVRDNLQGVYTPNALDVEVTLHNELEIVPGVTEIEIFDPKEPTQMVLHASPDYAAELIFFAAPYIGIKREGSTAWYNAGIPEGPRFSSVVFGEYLLFGNGNSGMFARKSGASSIEVVEGAPAARCYASFAGRVYAAHAELDGTREPLGIAWSGASSNHTDWSQFDSDGNETGAGAELLLDNIAVDDAIISLNPLGLDIMAVVMRRSVWIARRTGAYNRPASFESRVPGVGAVNQDCCKTTRFGVVFLNDLPGIYVFDGNSATWISQQISDDLAQLTKEQLFACSAAYNPLRQEYHLTTAIGTFIYSFETKRWHRRSLEILDGTVFATQLHVALWSEVTGTWGSREETWQDFKPEEQNDGEFSVLATVEGTHRLGRLDAAIRSNFGVDMSPFWEFPVATGVHANQLISIKQINIETEAEGNTFALLDLHSLDIDRNYVLVSTVVVRPAATEQIIPTFCETTGLGLSLRLGFHAGRAKVARAELAFIVRGQRLSATDLEPVIIQLQIGLLWEDVFGVASLDPRWRIAGSSNAALAVVTGELRVTFNGNDRGITLFPPISARSDIAVQATFRQSTNLFYTGFWLRSDLASSFYYSMVYGRDYVHGNSSSAMLYSRIVLPNSTLLTAAPVWNTNASSNFTLKAVQAGGQTKLYGDGTGFNGVINVPTTATGTYNDGSPLTGGYHGVTIYNSSGNPTLPVFVDAIRYCSSNIVTMSNLPTGYSIRVGGLTQVAVAGTAALDLAGKMWPQPQIEVLDASSTVKATLVTPVYGGSSFYYGG